MGALEALIEAINKNTEAIKERNSLTIEQNQMFANAATNLAELNGKAQVMPRSCDSSSTDDPVAAQLAGVSPDTPVVEEKPKRTRKPKEAPPVEQVIEEPVTDEFETEQEMAEPEEEEFQPTVEDVKSLTATVLSQDRFKNPVASIAQLKSEMGTFCDKVIKSPKKASEMTPEQLKKFYVYLTALNVNIDAGKYGEIK